VAWKTGTEEFVLMKCETQGVYIRLAERNTLKTHGLFLPYPAVLSTEFN